MGTSLTGLTPATTYDALIKVGDNGPIDATLKVLSDGLGNNLPMEASSTTINFTNGLQQSGIAVPTASQVNAKQDTLVSGTNIKTINGTSVLGAGNIVTPTTSPSGVSGAIQFSNGSAFASDASNLFWDNVNKRWGIGTNAPAYTFDLQSTSADPLRVKTTAPYFRAIFQNAGASGIFDFNSSSFQFPTNNVEFGTSSSLGARVGIKGSGSTSATTSLLLQNISGTQLLKVADNGEITILGLNGTPGNPRNFNSTNNELSFGCGYYYTFVTTGDNKIVFGTSWDGSNTYVYNQNRQVVGSNSIAASAVLQADSTTKGFLPPRMTTTQKNAIATPASGLVVYDSTTNKLCCYNGSTWNDLF